MKTPAPFFVLALAASLAGCALFPSKEDQAIRQSPAYQAGYHDGCAAANAAGASFRYGPVQNEDVFRSNDIYRAGWNTGYSACRQSMQMPGSQPGHPIPEPLPGR